LTADWRKLYVKPPLSDEVTRLRLLAEDATEHKKMSDALEDYLAGVDADPTWAQGWFKAALLYAEQQDYDDAVFSMKHYLILLPDAPDAAAAKEKLLSWVTKMHETAATAPAGQGTKAK
jgi:regulator of sirC expression with transglutaminase-like and TPR domain